MDRRDLPPATFAALSAVLHAVALAVSGFAANLGTPIIGALVWAALAYGLFKGSRAVAYLAFVMALVGISAALGIAMGAASAPVHWIWMAVVAADALIALTLFTVLWRPRTA